MQATDAELRMALNDLVRAVDALVHTPGPPADRTDLPDPARDRLEDELRVASDLLTPSLQGHLANALRALDKAGHVATLQRRSGEFDADALETAVRHAYEALDADAASRSV